MIVKSYIAEQDYSALNNYKSILFYGENAIRENQKDNQRIYISI